MKTLIIGCGYIGLETGKRLAARGHSVAGLRRSSSMDETMTQAGITPLRADITREEDLARIPKEWDWIVFSASASGGGPEAYRNVYLEGARRLVCHFKDRPPAKFVYTGSTGVYGQTDGSPVDETSPTEPANETGKILIEAERVFIEAFRNHDFPSIVLRIAGIYGPGRGFLFKRFLQGEARLRGDGRRILNMAHRDDIAAAVLAALEKGRPGEIYNVADDEPVPEADFYRWLSEKTGRPMPPREAPEESARRRRGRGNRKVLNGKLKRELNFAFQFPSFREGLAAELSGRASL